MNSNRDAENWMRDVRLQTNMSADEKVLAEMFRARRQETHPLSWAVVRMGRVAALVAISVAAGFLGGRHSLSGGTQVSTEQLSAAIDEKISQAQVDRQIAGLVREIEIARIEDRRYVSAALERIELNRLRDRNELGQGLVAFAIRTDEIVGTIGRDQ